MLHDVDLRDPQTGRRSTLQPRRDRWCRPSQAPLPADLAVYLDQVERDILERALARHRFNRTAAGASLGLSLRQMRYRMARDRASAAPTPIGRTA